jgi:putative transposase
VTLTEMPALKRVPDHQQELGDGSGRPVPAPSPADTEAVPADVVERLMAQVRAGDLELLGDGGVIAQLTKKLLERALDEELTDHVGYDRGDPAGRGSGNSRNGTTPKRVLTELGAVDLDVPRDRNGTFEPLIVPKGATRLAKFNDNVIALYAGGMTTRDIRKTLKRMYGVEVSPDLISRVTDGVIDELKEWQHRPLDSVYPIVYVDALVV